MPTAKQDAVKKPKRKNKTSEQKQFLEEVRDDYRKFVKKADAFFSKITVEFNHLKKENISCLLHMKRELDEHKEALKIIGKISDSAEETLCNVLLAIRQNEYLQAYYPEQLGYKAMKVTGTHPAKIGKEEKLDEEIS